MLALEYLLECFESPHFPRTIQANNGKQITVNSINEILYHFERVNWIDCRISLFSAKDIENIHPNALFIDLDDVDSLYYVKLRIFNLIGGRPLIIFTGRGYAIVQPIQIEHMNGLIYKGLTPSEISKHFLKFSKNYLTNNKADTANYPSLKNCLVRVPFTINSKSGLDVELVESWDNRRVSVSKLPFKKYLDNVVEEKREKNETVIINPRSYSWIENILEGPPIYKSNRILGLVIARYLMNVKKTTKSEAVEIIRKWDRGYDTSQINYELNYALKHGKGPVGLKQFAAKNPDFAKEFEKIPNLTRVNPKTRELTETVLSNQPGQSIFVKTDDIKKHEAPKSIIGKCYICDDTKVNYYGQLADGRIVIYCTYCYCLVDECVKTFRNREVH